MKTYDDLIRNLFKLGREDAVQALGELYDRSHRDIRKKVDAQTERHTTSQLLSATLVWDDSPQGDEWWREIYNDLQGIGE